MKIKTTLFFLLTFNHLLFSQAVMRPGFIILSEGDTIKGFLNYREDNSVFRYCTFAPATELSARRYYAGKLKGYGFDEDRYFESVQPGRGLDESDSLFAEVLVKGLASLYRYENRFYVEKDSTGLLQLENESKEITVQGRRAIRESKRYVGILSWMLSDCQSLRPAILSLDLDERSLTDLLSEYNQCRGGNPKIYKIKKKWVGVEAGIDAGIIRSSQSFGRKEVMPEYLAQGFVSTSPFAGLSLSISFPRVSERISLITDPFYYKFESYLGIMVNDDYGIVYHDINVSQASFSLPLSLRISTVEKRNNLYLQAGFVCDLILDSEVLLVSEYLEGNVVNTYTAPLDLLDSNLLGFAAGAGYRRNFQKFGVGIALNYSSLFSGETTSSYKTFENRFKLAITIITR